jgi:hypothetical protein
MLSAETVRELRSSWLPNVTDTGLDRLIDLLETNSPLLIHGCFTRAVPMGCLATHIAWHHPATAHLTVDAGISWMNRVAHLNPATSHVIREWDGCLPQNWELRAELLALLTAERQTRRQGRKPARATPALVEV